MKKVAIDVDVCASSSTCVGMVPEVFEMGGDGCIRILSGADQHLSDAFVARAEEAANMCPTGAISILVEE